MSSRSPMPTHCRGCGKPLYREGSTPIEGGEIHRARGYSNACMKKLEREDKQTMQMTPAQAAAALDGFLRERRRRGVPCGGTMAGPGWDKDVTEWIKEYAHVRSLTR